MHFMNSTCEQPAHCHWGCEHTYSRDVDTATPHMCCDVSVMVIVSPSLLFTGLLRCGSQLAMTGWGASHKTVSLYALLAQKKHLIRFVFLSLP